MKKLNFTLLMLSIAFFASSQTENQVPYYNWSNPITYQVSPPPIVTGVGEFSDWLSKENDSKTFFEYNGEYYKVETWADYYYWYTKKFWFNFDNSQAYEFFYYTRNDFGMASFIASNFRGRYYPTKIVVSFTGKNVKNNKMSDLKYVATNAEQVEIARSTDVKESNYKKKNKAFSHKIYDIKYVNHEMSNISQSSSSRSKSGNSAGTGNSGRTMNSQSFKPSRSSSSTTKTTNK